jgi:hypothetical protein
MSKKIFKLSENTQHDCAHEGESNIRGDYAQLADEGTRDVHSDLPSSAGSGHYLLGPERSS